MDRSIVPGSEPLAPGRLFADLPTACIPLRGCILLAKAVPAGCPSTADDYAEERLSLDEHFIENQEATFLVRVSGDSMTGFGIHDGDLLVVDRARRPAERSVVVAVVDGEFSVKQLCRIPAGVLLRAGTPGHGDILVGEDQELAVWGVVTSSIHRLI